MGKKLAVLISLVFIIAAFHSLFHLIVNGTGISGIADSGISGLSIGKISFDRDIKPRYESISQTSILILIAEWSLLIVLSVSAFIKHRQSLHEKIKSRPLIEKHKTKTKTDLDVLYEILKEKKHLRISTIAGIFNVSREVALSWAKTLEAANLAALHYPRVGEPELTIEE